MAVDDTNLLDCIFETADLATEKQPCHCSRHGGRDPELAASECRSQHAPETMRIPEPDIRFTLLNL